MNVREIVTAHLKAGGFDGLACDGCFCGFDDLMLCFGKDARQCQPAKAGNCTEPIVTKKEETHL